MKNNNTLDRVLEILKSIFDVNETVVIDKNSTAENIEEWDSLAHINIIAQIEREFSIKFSLDEISRIDSVSSIISSIESKNSSNGL